MSGFLLFLALNALPLAAAVSAGYGAEQLRLSGCLGNRASVAVAAVVYLTSAVVSALFGLWVAAVPLTLGGLCMAVALWFTGRRAGGAS